MNIAAVYIRVSTDSQTEYSPDAQFKAIKEYAKKHDIEIDPRYIFKDEGISGRKAEKRPAFMEMIRIAKSKPSPFNKILVHKFDRFARNREDSIVYKSLLKKECKVDVISITEDFGEDKFSVILEAMLEAMAEYYSLNLSDEVLKGMTEKAHRGEIQQQAPFGYINKNKTLEIDEDKAGIVKLVYNDFLNGNSYKNIVRKLNSLSIKSKRGNKWEVRTIEYMLMNPVYKGYVTFTPGSKNSWNIVNRRKMDSSICVKGNFKPIIDENTWNKVNEKIEHNKSMYKYEKKEYNIRWISRLIKCSNCGSTLTTQTQGLQCIGYCHGTCTESHYISYNKIETVILEQLKKNYNDPVEIHFSQKQTDETDIIEKKRKHLQDKLIRSKELYLDGIDTKEEYKKTKEEIEKQLQKLKPPKKKPIKEFNLKAKEIYDIMVDKKVNEKIKYTAIHNLIDYIIYDKKNDSIDIYYK